MIRFSTSARPSFLPAITALAFVLAAEPAHAQFRHSNMPLSLVPEGRSTIAEDVKRMFEKQSPPAAKPAAAAKPARPPMPKKKTARPKPPPAADIQPVMAEAKAEAAPSAPEPNTTSSAAKIGDITDIVPVVVRTVREIVVPEPDLPVISPNELSDIDKAARPVPASTAEASTDGKAARDIDEAIAEPASANAVTEPSRPLAQLPWLESLLLMAGALAAVLAFRMFAQRRRFSA